MPRSKGIPLDTSNLRYWKQNAHQAIRTIYDALIELITNADDSYVRLGAKEGRIEVEVERRRKGMPSILRVRDFAEGMTIDVMRNNLACLAGRVSGMAEGLAVRGTNSRGAKDIAILGSVSFESIANDGLYHKCEITAQGMFYPHESAPADEQLFSRQLKIPSGTGTVVTVSVASDTCRIPLHDKLRQETAQLVVLRDIFKSPHRTVVLTDVNKARSDEIRARETEGVERLKERIEVPGYPGAEAKLIVMRAKERLEDQRPMFRSGGVLIKSRQAIHEATLFDSELEHDPHAQWFYGRLACPYIDDLWNEFDDLFEKGLPGTAKNPRYVYDPMRKEGLSREHPFVQALFHECLKRLRPLVEEERRQAEGKQAKVESEATRKRLNALEKAAAKFMSENLEDESPTRNADDVIPDSKFSKHGFNLSPPFAQIIVGNSVRFCLSIKQAVFPELSVGDSVSISCLTDEITTSKRLDVLEAHPNQDGVLRSVWAAKGERATKATAIRALVGPVSAESTIEVLDSEREKYADVKDLCFSKKHYGVQVGSTKTVYLLAPFPGVVSERSDVELTCSEDGFKIGGSRVLEPRPDLGVALAKLRITSDKPGRRAVLTASAVGRKCEAQLISLEPSGMPMKIDLVPTDFGSQRYRWRENVLEIATRHRSLSRYLGPAPKFQGQEEKHFRVLLAEIVAEAVCSKMIERNQHERPEEYTEYDWSAYYYEYTQLASRFLPIAHDTQV